jgi:hypothetical protein
MSRVKVLAVFAVLIALVVLLSGLTIKGIYSSPLNWQERVFSETFTMQANTTTHRSLTLNQSGTYSIIVNTPNDYTVLSASVSEDSLQKWQNGQFNASWDGNMYGDGSWYGLSGNCKSYSAEVKDNQTIGTENVAFWNPEMFSKQVTLLAYRQWHEMDNASLNMGNLFTATGAAGLIGITAFFVIKNRAQVRFTRKMLFVLLVSLLMVASGVFLADTFSRPVEAQTVLAEGTINVPTDGYPAIVYSRSASGIYLFHIKTDKGTIRAFHRSENSTKTTWMNGTELDIRDIPDYQNFEGSSGDFGYSGYLEKPDSEYLLLSNEDSFSKNVSYKVSFRWTYDNYFAMMAGIALGIFGAIAFVLTLLKHKLRDFNRALETQE